MKKFLLCIVLLSISIKLSAQLNNTSEIEKWIKKENIPTLGLGIIENGKLSQVQVFGDLKTNQKAPYNTIFNVASITKPVTAIVALKLISQGKWKLDEPLYNYWIDPDIKDDINTKVLTTRHVLSHQTGFLNWRKGKLKFMFAPGTQYQYSGEGFEYLRIALENKFHKTLNELATELIFDPLKMENTTYVWDDNTDESRVASGFDKNGSSYKTHKRKINNGADDLLTTIKDYGTFLISVMNGEGLSDEIFKEMQKNQVKIKNNNHFGLGFVKYHFKDRNYALSHGGSDNGVKTITVIFPKTKQGLLIFTNSDNGYKIYEKLLPLYLGTYGKEIIEIEIGKKVTSENKPQVYNPVDKELYNQILSKDKEFFDAYNNCDLKTQANIYSSDVEFFHDKGGLMTSKKDIIAATQKYICGKVTRTLIKNTSEVYPIKDYGAIQIGYHKFYNNQDPKAISTPSKFITTWKNENGTWKMAKIISLH